MQNEFQKMAVILPLWTDGSWNSRFLPVMPKNGSLKGEKLCHYNERSPFFANYSINTGRPSITGGCHNGGRSYNPRVSGWDGDFST